MNYLDIEISCFANYYSQSEPKKVNLLSWLQSDKYRLQVDAIRATSDKRERNKLKAALPACTPSGIFDSEKKLIRHSGLICLDIDLQDNTEIENFTSLKSELCKIQNIAYCGLSVSGNGYFVLIPIAYPDQHEKHFDSLKQDFANISITIDKACRNINRLRGYSYDSEAYFNEDAKLYTKITQPLKTPLFMPSYSNDNNRTEQLIQKIIDSGVDITGDYKQWLNIGCSLANEFGDHGRAYYHAISEKHPKYKQSECDKQFDQCIKHDYSIKIESLFFYAKHYNITLI